MTKKRSTTSSIGRTEPKKAKAISFDGILKAIRLRTAEDFQELLAQGLISNINVTNDRGETLLMIQCINSYLEGAELLIEHGADMNITDGQGNSALILACRHYKDARKEECSEVIELLVAKGANINEVSVYSSPIRGVERGTVLFEACIKGRLEVVPLLMKLGAAINATNQNPLIESCVLHNMDVVRFLIAHGADVNIIDYYGNTCLSVASLKGIDDIVELLLDHGADINLVRDIYRYTPFILLEYGADINAENEVGYCALGAADECNRLDTAKLLLERGAYLYKEDGVTSVATLRRGVLAKNPALIEKYGEINKRVYRGLQPLLK